MALLIWADGSHIHYLIEKYKDQKGPIPTAIDRIVEADNHLLEGSKESVLTKDSMPDMAALDRWTDENDRFYQSGLDLLVEQERVEPFNPDIFALKGYCYCRQDKHEEGIKAHILAVELGGYSQPFVDEMISAVDFYFAEKRRRG
jgi:hypothetical protein